MIRYAVSKRGVRIRSTEERWLHIIESHDYMAGLSDVVLDCIEDPEIIVEGEKNELISTKRFNNKDVVVIYKEVSSDDGFIITAFITSEVERVLKGRKITWKKEL